MQTTWETTQENVMKSE